MRGKALIGWLIAVLAIVVVVSTYVLPSDEGMITVGVARWATNTEFDRSVDGFKMGLAEKGYVEGQNISSLSEIRKQT